MQIRRQGHQVSRTFRLRTDAELWARQLEAELDRGGLPTDSRRLRAHNLADLARENPSFLAMAECGRQKRLAECVPNNACSPEGTMFMQYIDILVVSVKKKELTEAEALRRYTEYKAGGTPSHP